MAAGRRRRQHQPAERDSSLDDSDEDRQPPPPRRTAISDSDTDEDVEELLLGRRRPEQNRDGPRQNNRDFKIKVDLPAFDGRLHIEDFLDWIHTVENFFDYAAIDENQKVKIVAYKLKAGASAWWEQLQHNRRREGKTPIRSWPRMKRLLKTRFLLSDYEQILYQQLQQCRQRYRSVADYTEEFYRLGARVDLQESEQQQVARYIGGLKEAIQDQLALKSIWTLSDAVNLAYRSELQLSKTMPKQFAGRRTITEVEGDRKKLNSPGLAADGISSSRRTTEAAPASLKPPQATHRPSNPYAKPMPG